MCMENSNQQSDVFFLPVFPLHVVVFPGEVFNLHIFEPRYKQLVHHVKENNGLFGVLPVLNKRPTDFLTVVELKSIYRTYPDGAMDIRTHGRQVVRLLNFDQKNERFAYPSGVVTAKHHLQPGLAHSAAVPSVWQRFREALFELSHHLGVTRNFIPSENHFAVFKVVHYLGFSPEQEYELLFCSNETERMLWVINMLQKMLPDVKHKEEMRHRISLNGHFKELKSPEF